MSECFNEDLRRTRSLRTRPEDAGTSEDVKTKTSDSLLSKPEVKKKISVNDKVKPQSDLNANVGSKVGDPVDSAKQERLKKANEQKV